MPNIFHNSLSLGYPAGGSYPTSDLLARFTFNDTLIDEINSYVWSLTSGTTIYDTGLIGNCLYFNGSTKFTSMFLRATGIIQILILIVFG